MKICRVNDYNDVRFRKSILFSHGGFLVDNKPYEVEIISINEAIIYGKNKHLYNIVIKEFEKYAPNICVFYDKERNIVKRKQKPIILSIPICEINLTQFYIDEIKLDSVQKSIKNINEIVIQVSKYNNKYICVDGHTRLYYLANKGEKNVNVILVKPDYYILDFLLEANRRNIYNVYDLSLISHIDYKDKWLNYCENYFKNIGYKE